MHETEIPAPLCTIARLVSKVPPRFTRPRCGAMSRVVTRGLWLHTQLVGWSEIMRLRGTQKPCRHDKYKLARLHGMLIAAPQGVLLSQMWIALCQAS